MVTMTDTVVVTGGAGFIGGHVVELLLQKNYHVIVIDIQHPCTSYFFLNRLDQKVDYRIVDIRNKKQVDAFFNLVHPAYVIHLAAQPIVQEAYDHPYEAFETNIMGTVNILEACRKQPGIKGIIVASSDKAYGKTKKTYTEKSPLQGDHPYDVSKSCEDLIAYTYFKTYDLPVVVTRFGNVYGEGDMHFDRIVPGICQAVIKNETLPIRSDGTYIRDYLYVKDVAKGYLLLMEKCGDKKANIKGEAYNFSSKDNLSVLTMIQKAQKSLKQRIPYDILNIAQNEIPYQHLSDQKIRTLGWKNSVRYIDILPSVIHWYKNVVK